MSAGSVHVLERTEFERLFRALTNIERPYEWQWNLFQDFARGSFPHAVTLPTGLGKTSVIPIWLLAFVSQIAHRPESRSVPTRLVWVVDRRVVVDQATAEAEKLVEGLQRLPARDLFRIALEQCSVIGRSDGLLAISTLRGERADNRAWSVDPSRPAIIIGTVDMIGSRLLFSGYGDSRRRRPLHAGLLGQDTLIVNDEAHLTAAFAALVIRLGELSKGERPVRTMLLSATLAAETPHAFPTSLGEDLNNEVFASRYRAVKRLHLHEHKHPKSKLAELACIPYQRTLIFVHSPRDAQKLGATIERRFKGVRVPLITGIQRGWERDRLLEDPIVQRFMAKTSKASEDPCWLIATSAGEVGIDLSSDRVVSELDTADHLLQRFGRLNRFGETEGDAHVIYSETQFAGDKDCARRLAATVQYLSKLPDVSLERLRAAPPPSDAICPHPHQAPLLPWHIDVWSMTAISATEWPSRPEVDAWLHSDEEDSPPETYVAWREDVQDLADPKNGLTQAELDLVFSVYRVFAHERLKDYTESLCKSLAESPYLGKLAILIAADREVFADTLANLLKTPQRFRYATLLLPPGIGYLDDNGMVDWTRPTNAMPDHELRRYDVADLGVARSRFRVTPGEPEPQTDLRFRCSIQLRRDDGEGVRWMYYSGGLDNWTSPKAQLLSEHAMQVSDTARVLAESIGLHTRIARVFGWAGYWHDKGKDRRFWQLAAGNVSGGCALAKSTRFNGRILGGYRHELGSLLDAEAELPLDFSPQERDLALHLIASHHGWARPHFPDVAHDKTAIRRSRMIALECPRRFGRLQSKYGAWGLAYLEAVFRSADAIASADTPELPLDA